MIITPELTRNGDDQVYVKAVARLKKDMGLTERRAQAVIAEIAQAYGVYLDDVAQAVVGARTVKRGLANALRTVQWDRRTAYGLTD